MIKKNVLLLFIFLTLFVYAKPLNLSPKDIKIKSDEILRSHASYKKITPAIAERILKNFIWKKSPRCVHIQIV